MSSPAPPTLCERSGPIREHVLGAQVVEEGDGLRRRHGSGEAGSELGCNLISPAPTGALSGHSWEGVPGPQCVLRAGTRAPHHMEVSLNPTPEFRVGTSSALSLMLYPIFLCLF